MSKTLGQIAYEGWDSDVLTHTPWSEVRAGFQAAWQAAAEAVVAEVERNLPRDTMLLLKEEAVIEAAKEWCRRWKSNEDGEWALVAAIDALQEVEGEST